MMAPLKKAMLMESKCVLGFLYKIIAGRGREKWQKRKLAKLFQEERRY